MEKPNVDYLTEPFDPSKALEVNPDVQAFDFEGLQRISAKLGVISLKEVRSSDQFDIED